MYIRVHHPATISAKALDRYLRLGWYRIGQAMVTCQFLWSENGELRDAVWTRTDLQSHRVKRSHRRIHKRNLAKYTVSEGPFRLDAEHEEVYSRYLSVARGSRSDTLNGAMNGNMPYNRFQSRELSIRTADGRLAAFSTFDVGEDSLQSLMGVYDPEFSRDGLGFWSLLLEVEHAKKLGLRFHYSGYVLPGDPSMDYKLRVGAMEYLHAGSSEWRAWSRFNQDELGSKQLRQALANAETGLIHAGFLTDCVQYRYHEMGAWNPQLGRTLAHPLALLVARSWDGPDARVHAWWVMVVYRLDRKRYEVLKVLRALGRPADDPTVELNLWVVSERAAACESPGEVVAAVERVLDFDPWRPNEGD